jgi:hypothetical protein
MAVQCISTIILDQVTDKLECAEFVLGNFEPTSACDRKLLLSVASAIRVVEGCSIHVSEYEVTGDNERHSRATTVLRHFGHWSFLSCSTPAESIGSKGVEVNLDQVSILDDDGAASTNLSMLA